MTLNGLHPSLPSQTVSSQASGQSAQLEVAFVTVCLPPETVEAAQQAAARAGWLLHEAHFDAYISQRRRPHLGSHLHAGQACIALVDFDHDPLAAAEATAFLQQAFSGRIVLIAVSTSTQPTAILLAMRAGCAEFLAHPVLAVDLDHALLRVEEHWRTLHAGAPPAGSLLAFFGAKGGVGATTLALHLATFLAETHRRKVLLIDNHAQFGHACIYLGLDGSEIHFQELVRNVSRLDSELLRGFIATHASGIDVLSSPDIGKAARPMHPDDVAATLEFLRGEYDFVLVDCEAILDDVNRAVVAAATHVYVVATPEISAIRDLSRYVDDLVALPDTRDKVHVILNRFASQFAVSLETVEKAIRLPVSFCIPNNYVELVRSANLGVPVSPESKSGFATDLRRWANALVGVKDDAPVVAEATRHHANPWESLKGTLSVLLQPAAVAARKRA